MIFKFLNVEWAPYFSQNKKEEWLSWTWQMQNALTTQDDFQKVFKLFDSELRGFEVAANLFKVSATPYYASLALQLEGSNPLQPGPLRRIFIPTSLEGENGAQQMLDPLDENNHTPTPRIVHRYSDRVLFLITDTCSVYCRFCTRKRFTASDQGLANSKEYNEALHYIRTHPGIREVIFTGGDPLILGNNILKKVLRDVRNIPHIEIIRIGTRMPVVCPMRIDKELCEIFKEAGPVYLMNHFSHPRELTAEAKSALTLMADHGIPLFNQMVLLNGVNNHPAIIQALSRRLLYLRVKPYYMFQCDPSQGTDHLRTTVESSEELVRELWGHLSGLAMPTLSLDVPSGGGKATLVPNFMVQQSGGVREFVGWDGKRGVYKNPEVPMIQPMDVSDYREEWELLKNSKKISCKTPPTKSSQGEQISPQIS